MGADQQHDWNALTAATLEWWRDAGVDVLVDDEPHDWLARRRPVPTPVAVAIEPEHDPVPELPGSLDAFLTWRTGPDAPERDWNGAFAFPEGDPAAPLMIFTDMPDADGLIAGENGRLFERMLAAIGLDRTRVYLAPVAHVRPLSGRVAPEAEVELGRLARHHVALAAPRIVLTLGQAASRAVLGTDGTIGAPSLHPINLKSATIMAVASLHPRYLLRQPAHKARVWEDLQLLMGGLR